MFCLGVYFLHKNHFISCFVGLCRTSEIFGASALVVGSLHYIQDKQFQHLSVSAEQWLPLVEVNRNILIAKKRMQHLQFVTCIVQFLTFFILKKYHFV